MSALDRYDPNLLDDEEYSNISQEERIAAEVEMRKRDRAAGIIRDDRDLLYGNFYHVFFEQKNYHMSKNIIIRIIILSIRLN